MREKSHSSRKLLCTSKPFFSLRVHDGQSWKKVTVSWTRNLSVHPTTRSSSSARVALHLGHAQVPSNGFPLSTFPLNTWLGRLGWLAGLGVGILDIFIPVPYQSQISNLSRKSLSATRPCEGPCSLSPKKNPRGPGQQGAGSLSHSPPFPILYCRFRLGRLE